MVGYTAVPKDLDLEKKLGGFRDDSARGKLIATSRNSNEGWRKEVSEGGLYTGRKNTNQCYRLGANHNHHNKGYH